MRVPSFVARSGWRGHHVAVREKMRNGSWARKLMTDEQDNLDMKSRGVMSAKGQRYSQ
jgi:hypothetical protein